MRGGHTVAMVVWATAACTVEVETTAPAPGTTPAVVRFDIDDGDELHVVGFDATGAIVGRIDVSYGEYTDPETGQNQTGRILDLTVGDFTVNHRAEGALPVDLPAPGPEDAQAFLLDDRLDAALARWGVAVHRPSVPILIVGAPPEQDSEVDYAGCWHATTNMCGASDCCEGYLIEPQYPDETGQSVCCAGSGTGAFRTCTEPFGTTQCGPTGNNGCAVCWSFPHDPGWNCWTTWDGMGCGLGGCYSNGAGCQGNQYCCSGNCLGGVCRDPRPTVTNLGLGCDDNGCIWLAGNHHGTSCKVDIWSIYWEYLGEGEDLVCYGTGHTTIRIPQWIRDSRSQIFVSVFNFDSGQGSLARSITIGPPICGDGMCESGETCDYCPGDCGDCCYLIPPMFCL